MKSNKSELITENEGKVKSMDNCFDASHVTCSTATVFIMDYRWISWKMLSKYIGISYHIHRFPHLFSSVACVCMCVFVCALVSIKHALFACFMVCDVWAKDALRGKCVMNIPSYIWYVCTHTSLQDSLGVFLLLFSSLHFLLLHISSTI